jgi:predicted nucleotidyltransferase
MRTRQEIIQGLRRALPELEREFGVKRLGLFGSCAHGTAADESDVDVLVEFDPQLGLRFVDLAERIEALLGAPADVVSRRAIPPRYGAEIEKELVDVA